MEHAEARKEGVVAVFARDTHSEWYKEVRFAWQALD